MAGQKRCARFFAWMVLMIVLESFSGCGIHQGGVPEDLSFAGVDSGTAATGERDYRILPGDQLDIGFFYNPRFDVSIPVRPDGKISLQLIGEVPVAGLTPSELVTELKKRYSQELREPEINVTIRGFSGQQIYVDGEVERPGAMDLMPRLTVWQAIIKAGGFRETATRESIILIRRGSKGEAVPFRLNLKSEHLNQAEAVFELRPFDVIFVPKTWISEANKFVEQYIEKLILFRGWYLNLTPFGPFVNQ